MMNKGVSPCDRRIGRRKVAIAALAAVLLFATNARGNQVLFDIRPDLSELGFVERITAAGVGTFVFHRWGSAFTAGDPALNPGVALTPAYGAALGSFTAAWGNFKVDVNTGASLQFTTDGLVNYFNNTQNIGFGPGVFPPFRDGGNNVVAPPGGIPHASQFGFQISHQFAGPGFGAANVFHLEHNFGNATTGAVDGGPIVTWSAGTTYAGYTGVNSLMAMDGWEDVYGPTVDSIYLPQAGPSSTPFPSPFAGNPITWDPADPTAGPLGTLTIPVTFHLNFTDDDLVYDIDTFGQIVATPRVPEPSTILLLGFGVVGLLSAAWRARKKRALVA
jgi:hypothetical protein